MVESQPSKLLVAGSIPVSRSIGTVISDEWRVTSKRFFFGSSQVTHHCS